jgi:Rnl2 family RNA ligase
MFEFHKYPSIDNSYRNKTVQQVQLHGFDKGEWVVLLKVHGANFSLWSDGEKVVPAKRSSFIKNVENFCNCDTVVDELKDNVLNLTNHLKEKYGCEVVTVYGELAGGDYPHPDVEKHPNAKKVQKGVFYAPFNFFYMFDIVVDGKFINHDEVVDLGHEFGIIVAEPLLRGSFDECLKYPNLFEDPLHFMFGLPSIENVDNVCEGVVLKPVESCFFGNGCRCILKNKNEKFSEKQKVKKTKKQGIKLSDEAKRLYEEACTYVTENRLRNVVSHGLVLSNEKKAFGVIMKEMNKDVFDDFLKDCGDDFRKLESSEQKKISKTLNKNVANLVRPHFRNILDGEF